MPGIEPTTSRARGVRGVSAVPIGLWIVRIYTDLTTKLLFYVSVEVIIFVTECESFWHKTNTEWVNNQTSDFFALDC